MSKREKSGLDYCGDTAVTVCLSLGWFGWVIWEMTSRKSGGTIFGLVAVFLVLFGLSLMLYKEMLRGLGFIIAAPFGIVFIVAFIIFRLILLILSLALVPSPRPSWTKVSKPDYCRLCERCDSIVYKSNLLLGTPWILTRKMEKYPFYNESELRESAGRCHMCAILLHSVPGLVRDSKSAEAADNTTEFSKPRSAAEGSKLQDLETAIASNRHSAPELNTLELRIWMRRRFFEAPEIKMQLRGKSAVKSKPLIIGKGTKAGKEFSHRCFNSVYTDSDDIMRWANEWVARCVKEHPQCRSQFVALNQRTYLPLRLLDVENSHNGLIHLASGADLKDVDHVEYCALSHCWGGTVNLKLTKSTLESMRSIETSALPRNFKDAVEIARHLKIRYLWIDSLCIMQDDSKEWEIESTNMGLIFANAKVVISATASKDSTGGCFLPRELSYDNCVLCNVGPQSIVLEASDQYSPTSKLFEQKVDMMPLGTRGWTFQERYLARRILHFTQGLVLFECNTLMASKHANEGQRYGARFAIRSDGKGHASSDLQCVNTHVWKYIPKDAGYRNGDLSKHRRMKRKAWERNRVINPKYTIQEKTKQQLASASAQGGVRGAFDLLWHFSGENLAEQAEFHTSWFDLVEQYSDRHLTFGTDKGIAIAGIAYFIQQKTGFQYAAGLWTDNLTFNLLWALDGEPETRPIRSAPTWSWTSIDGKIKNRLNVYGSTSGDEHWLSSSFQTSWKNITPLIARGEVMQAETVNGLIHNGTLELVGLLYKITGDTVSERACGLSEDNVICLPVLESEVDLENSITTTGAAPGREQQRRTLRAAFDVADHPPLQDVYGLPVLSFTNSKVNPKARPDQIHGILLQPKNGATDCFERVGYFWSDSVAVIKPLTAPLHRRTIRIV